MLSMCALTSLCVCVYVNYHWRHLSVSAHKHYLGGAICWLHQQEDLFAEKQMIDMLSDYFSNDKHLVAVLKSSGDVTVNCSLAAPGRWDNCSEVL